MPPRNRLEPCTLRLTDPPLAPKFTRDARAGMDNPPELILLPMLPPTILPIEFVIRGPTFPKIGDIPNPGTELRLPAVPGLEEIPGIEPFMLLLKAGPPATLIPPLFVSPE